MVSSKSSPAALPDDAVDPTARTETALYRGYAAFLILIIASLMLSGLWVEERFRGSISQVL